MKLLKSPLDRFLSEGADSGNQGGEVAPELNVVKIPVSFNAKYKKEKNSKGEMVTATVKVMKDGKEVEEKVVETPAKTVTAIVTVPKFADLSQDILVSLYNTRLEQLAAANVKGEDSKSLVNGAEFSYTLTAADFIGETQEISEELWETAKTSFMEYLAKQGKSEKAQKNNAILLGASVTKLFTTAENIISAYEGNLAKFVEASSSELISEIEPVLSRATRFLERAKNKSTEDII